jgi:hypothetical protein
LKKSAGLWIDHRKAVIVIVSEAGEEIKEISSNMGKHVRFTGGTASEDGSTEDVRDRQFGNGSTAITMQSSLLFGVQAPSKYLVLVRPKASW